MPSFWLEVQQSGATQQHSFSRVPVVMGRDRGVDLVLDHPTVSRQHAQIVHDSQRGFRLVVLSGGLTVVDGAQASGEVAVYNGSVLTLGQLHVTFRSNEAAPRPAAGAPGAGAGFGQAPGGYGQAPGGFGQAPGGFGQAPGGFGQAPGGFDAGGGFGQPPVGMASSPSPFSANQPPPAAPSGFNAQPQAAGGKATNVWDEIAQRANDVDDDDDGPREDDYFKRMQAAEERGQEKSKGGGKSPLLIVGAVLIIGLLVFIFMPSGGGSGGGGVAGNDDGDQPPALIIVQCGDSEDCKGKAVERYKLAKELYEKKDVRLGNAFLSYKAILETRAFLEQGKLEPTPEMAKIDEIASEVRGELDVIYREQQRNYLTYKKNRMYSKMVESLDIVRSYFPDKSTPEQQWAISKEREMRKDGVYPK